MLYVSDLAAAYRVNLPSGKYSVSVSDAGFVVEGSIRALDVVAPTSRSAVTIDVVPEERWTRVLGSFTKSDTIYLAPGKTFYAVLNQSDRFDEKVYRSLVDPQGFGQAGRDLWIRRGPAPDKRLEVRQPDGRWVAVERRAYKVRQTQGEQLGYVIEPAAPDETPDISAFEVRVPRSNTGSFSLRVVDIATERIEPGTQRDVVVVSEVDSWFLWGASTLPLVLGFGVLGLRKWRRKA